VCIIIIIIIVVVAAPRFLDFLVHLLQNSVAVKELWNRLLRIYLRSQLTNLLTNHLYRIKSRIFVAKSFVPGRYDLVGSEGLRPSLPLFSVLNHINVFRTFTKWFSNTVMLFFHLHQPPNSSFFKLDSSISTLCDISLLLILSQCSFRPKFMDVPQLLALRWAVLRHFILTLCLQESCVMIP